VVVFFFFSTPRDQLFLDPRTAMDPSVLPLPRGRMNSRGVVPREVSNRFLYITAMTRQNLFGKARLVVFSLSSLKSSPVIDPSLAGVHILCLFLDGLQFTY